VVFRPQTLLSQFAVYAMTATEKYILIILVLL